MAFTNAELVAIRRFCGFGTYSSFGYMADEQYANLGVRLSSMDADEIAVVRTIYLAVLPGLESDILAAGENLDTDKAAIWTRNKNEIADRRALFNQRRRDLCAFIGIDPGPGLTAGGMIIRT